MHTPFPKASTLTEPTSSALEDVNRRISKSAIAGGRKPSDAVLIAVSKTFPAEKILPIIQLGQRHFGENRVQEAMEKWPEIRKSVRDIVLHMIGPLQTNKVRDAVAHFDVIHSIDRPKLAEKLADEMHKQNRHLKCFVQINTGREQQKAGIDPSEAKDFIEACRQKWKLPVQGLMCIPPQGEEPSPHFAFLRELAHRNQLQCLSMGMSSDFEIAITLGATHVRVGSAIFGPRQ